MVWYASCHVQLLLRTLWMRSLLSQLSLDPPKALAQRVAVTCFTRFPRPTHRRYNTFPRSFERRALGATSGSQGQLHAGTAVSHLEGEEDEEARRALVLGGSRLAGLKWLLSNPTGWFCGWLWLSKPFWDPIFGGFGELLKYVAQYACCHIQLYS